MGLLRLLSQILSPAIQVKCHVCGHEEKIPNKTGPWRCPKCNAKHLVEQGRGAPL